MPRYKCVIEYDGQPFHGWQFQPHLPTVQGEIERVLEPLNQGHSVRTQVSGRTDAGVHAWGQVCHFDLVKDYLPHDVLMAMNYRLQPWPISVVSCHRVCDDFHARFSSKKRFYTYCIINRRAPLSIERQRAWGVFLPLDCHKMNQAAQLLLGTHDFSTFRASDCQAQSPVRTLDQCDVVRNEHHHDHISVHVHGRSFLHHQVRNIVGALVWVGKGKWSLDQFHQAFLACDRKKGAVTAPAQGLYFVKVTYE